MDAVFELPGGGACNQCGCVCRAETVVDIDDTYIGGAGVEHAEEGGGSGEAGPVSHGGRDSDDGDGDEASYYGGESSLHAGADDDGVGFCELVANAEEAVEAGYAYVVKSKDAGAEELGGDGGFFGDGDVAGACAKDGDAGLGVQGRGASVPQSDGAGFWVVEGGGDLNGYRGCVVRGGAGGEDAGTGGGHAGEDFGGLGGGLAGGVDDFG